MNTVFEKRLLNVAFGHFALILVVFVVSGWKHSSTRDSEINVPIQFLVQVDTGPVKDISENKVDIAPEVKQEPKEAPIIDPALNKKPPKRRYPISNWNRKREKTDELLFD